MPIRMMSPVPARVLQVLQDRLSAELALIDTEESDGITTPSIPNANYFDSEMLLINQYPACTAKTISAIPIEVKPDTFGRRVDAWHRLELGFHATLAQANSSGRTLEKLMHRYIAGAVRVLAVMYDGLQTIADPTRWGTPNVTTILRWSQPATYGPASAQADGLIVRSAILPIDVRRIEVR